MSKKIFCSIPDVCLDPAHPVATQVRSQLISALAAGFEPTGVPRGVKSQAVVIDEPELSKVLKMGEERQLVPGKIVGGLMYAQHLKGLARTNHASGGPSPAEPELTGLRAGQVRVLQQAAPLLSSGKVVFSECGTGTGKARLIAHTAAYLLALRDQGSGPGMPDIESMLNPGGAKPLPDFLATHIRGAADVHMQRREVDKVTPACVIACAPSIENVSHLVAEWIAVRSVVDPLGLRRVAIRLGRGQFVNRSALISLLDEADSEGRRHPKIRAWLNQMPAGKTAATKALLAIEPGLCGLMVDLMSVAGEDFRAGEPLVDIRASSLSNENELDDPEDSANYAAHMERYREGFDLLFTTTAMLCLDNLNLSNPGKPAFLPTNVAGLLIDEGHQLESVQANLAARGLSLSRLIADLKRLKDSTPGEHAKKALAKTLVLRDWLSAFPNETMLPPAGADAGQLDKWNAAVGQMRSIAADLTAMSATRQKKGSDTSKLKALGAIKAAASVMNYAASGGDFPARGVLHQSPVKGFVTLTFGPTSVARHLMARWAVTPCAILFSGTLFHMSAAGASARSVAASVGAITRYAQTDALHPSWLFKPVQLLTPSLENFHRYIPPKRDEATDAAMRSWLEAVANSIGRASADSKGGMLVLMTGYQRLEILRDLLMSSLPKEDQGRVIAQSPHSSVSVLAEEFRAMSRRGLRPIWLATGAAWTGLDLSDRDRAPEEDFMLTDLVIPAAPFGLERSTTHIHRMKAGGFVVELMGVQQKLRQGFGRLVRREGVTGRRIWMLDGRLINPATTQRFADLRRALNPYLNSRNLP